MQSKVETPDTTLIKIVKPIGDGAHIILPKAWLGRTVKVTSVKPVADREEGNLNNGRMD